ncbi:hypothetical protein BDV23DRAFT_155524 [Aspergillus alliaceus]|uniref:Uncharacterized protein n=1 Tax=Petromyces alliaceus TaxID=209559 RepID=A0A5N7C9S3_PETAA|nr:hypothetical protein BDV23DRAFT_155524 [Aspergillus alliaceus]
MELRIEADKRFNPLVWFLANQGGEWRVYGCVSNGKVVRVIDLWHGSVDSLYKIFWFFKILPKRVVFVSGRCDS